jgi:hypothetical protein
VSGARNQEQAQAQAQGRRRTPDERRTSRLLGALTLATAAAIYGACSGQAGLGLALAALAALPLVLRRRPTPGPSGQALLALAVCAVNLAVCRLLPAPRGAFRGLLGDLAQAVAIGATLLAVARQWLREPLGGARATVVVGLMGVVACGSSEPTPAYAALSVAYLLGASLWLRHDGLVDASPLPAAGRDRLALGAVLALTGALSAGLSLALPRAYDRMVELLAGELRPRIGFQEGPLELGSLDGLADSDTIVARVFSLRGARLLRGAVYRDYARGRWAAGAGLGAGLQLETPGGAVVAPAAGGAVARVDRGAGALTAGSSADEGASPVEVASERLDVPRYFVPLEARSIVIDAAQIRVDAFGILSPAPPARGAPGWVRYQPGKRDAFAPAPPEPADLSLPAESASQLRELARSWAPPGAGPGELMEAFSQRLERDHRYSLRYRRGPGRDPVLVFLLEKGDGHCEYFASALALLGRAAGVPTRLVAGYRVSEWNPLGRYHVVRERNAHAWVEAFVPGRGWASYDPSPRASVDAAGPSTTGPLAALGDALLLAARGGLAAAAARPAWLAAALVPMLAALLLREWRRSRRALAPAHAAAPGEAPFPCLTSLLAVLARRGLARSPAEPLERFAARVAEDQPEASALLLRYADLRYGGEGDLPSLARDIEAYAASRPRADVRPPSGRRPTTH